MELKIYQQINLHRPIMIAGWPGMGNVSLIATGYLRKELKAELFAEIDVSPFVVPDGVIVEKGMLKLPAPPKQTIYYRKHPDLIILEGDVQIRDKPGLILMEQIIKLIKEFQVSKIFTGAAFPLPINHDEPSTVYGCATTTILRDLLFREYKLKVMERGEISGLNGLLLGYAREIEVPAACLLATMPLYAINIPNPKASRAIIKVIEHILGIKIDTTKLDMEIERMEKEMTELEERLQEELGNPPLGIAEQTGEIPIYVRQKIERLFREARQDKDKAYTLKRELDKWNLFDSYEDRFLDLFKQH
ncbi:MAG: PAC2 family protein [Candidatus Stahlbacteria bacterium]|nr:PAC2 family protein [Candidatus Stahlbacteria bacterium]